MKSYVIRSNDKYRSYRAYQDHSAALETLSLMIWNRIRFQQFKKTHKPW